MDNTNKVYQGGEVLPTLSGVATQVPNLTLPKATPPTNVTAITNTPSFSVPSPSPSLGNTSSVGGLVSFYDQAFKVYDQQQADLQNQITQAKTTQATETAPWYSKLVGAKTPEEVRSSAMSDTGVDAKEYFAIQKASLEEIRKLNEDYNAEVAKKDEEINALRDNSEGRSEGGISQEVARVENRYATRLNQISANINTKSAIFEAEQGRFAEAQQYINQAVQDATAETRYNLELFNTFYRTNQDIIDSLDSKYQDAFKSALGFAEQKYQTDYQMKLKAISDAVGLNTYTVKAGDNLYEIARSMGITTESLLASNQAVDPMNLRPGQTINLPGKNYSQGTEISNIQLTQFINQQMATPEFKALSSKEKSDYILSQGGTPEDFGL